MRKADSETRLRTSEARKTVLVIAGMPGAGKSLASGVAERMGIRVFVSGDVIRDEAERRGLKPDKNNLGRLMLRIRRDEGMGAVAQRLKPLIEKEDGPHVVYEGPRNIEEVEELARHYRVVTIAIHASPKTRLQRLLARKRSDKPLNELDFSKRDERELKVGVGKVIALADRMVENEGSKTDLKRRMRRILDKLRVQGGSGSLSRQRSGARRTPRR